MFVSGLAIMTRLRSAEIRDYACSWFMVERAKSDLLFLDIEWNPVFCSTHFLNLARGFDKDEVFKNNVSREGGDVLRYAYKS